MLELSESVLIPDKPRIQAEILDIIDKEIDNTIYTKGGLELTTNNMDGIYRCVIKPVTEKGKKTIDHAITLYENNLDLKTFKQGPLRKYTPVTTLEFEGILGGHRGKRNKSKKPKRRNSRSKRRKTVSKRRR